MSEQSATWLDGIATSSLPLPDRGLDFGDGVFETLLLHNGKPLFSNLHFDRLSAGLHTLAIPDCLTAVQQQLDIAANTISWPWASLRISVLRSSGERGYAPSDNSPPRILINACQMDRDARQMSAAANLCLAKIQLAAQPLLAGIKHLNRLEQILAATQVKSEGMDEAILLDQSGQLVSVVAGNLFLVVGDTLLTPKLIDSGVLGTRRRLVMEKWAPAIGLAVHETTLTLLDLQNAEEVFYSNSLHTVRPIARFGEKYWDTHGICEALFEQYQEELI